MERIEKEHFYPYSERHFIISQGKSPDHIPGQGKHASSSAPLINKHSAGFISILQGQIHVILKTIFTFICRVVWFPYKWKGSTNQIGI